MKRQVVNGFVVIGVSGLLGVAISAGAAEHGGQEHQEHGGTTTAPAAKEHGGTTAAPAAKEHGGTTKEHGGQAVKAEPSAEQIRQTIQSHVQGMAQKQGTFAIKDPETGTTRNLELVRVHDRVGKTGGSYYSCTDMRDVDTKEMLDLDFDVQAGDGTLEVVDTRIHKVEGKARYTYDEQDNRLPIAPDAR